MLARGAKLYKRVDIQSASKVQVLDRLYERLLRDLADAQRAIAANDVKAKSKALGHAHLIVTELETALDPSQAPEICEHLSGLYGFVEDRMLTAGLRLDASVLDPAIAIISDLRQAFRTAARDA